MVRISRDIFDHKRCQQVMLIALSKCCDYETKIRCRFADADSNSNEILYSVAFASQSKNKSS